MADEVVEGVVGTQAEVVPEVGEIPGTHLEPNGGIPEHSVSAGSEGPDVPLEALGAGTGTPILGSGGMLVSTPEVGAEQQLAPTPVVVPPVYVASPQANPRSFLARALASIQFRKKAKLEKIVKLATEKGSITNDHVEKLLRVSDATATRYLAQLVKEGRLRKVGPDGRARYESVSGSNGGN